MSFQSPEQHSQPETPFPHVAAQGLMLLIQESNPSE
jgi:hypothetical protein